MTNQELAFERAGVGEPLLLLHGFGTTHGDFASLMPHLTANFDVLAVDLPGHGASPAIEARPTVDAVVDAIEAAIDAQGMGKVHVLGNSLGGRLAIELAVRGRALSVVAIAPSGMAALGERVQQAAMMAQARGINRLIRRWIPRMSRSRLGRTALLATFRARPWNAREEEALGMKGGFAEMTDYWSMLWWSLLADLPTRLQDIACPVILAQGTNDFIATGQALRFLPFIPRSHFEILFGGGHAPQSDTPKQIAALVRKAAATASASASAPLTRSPTLAAA